MSEKTELLPCPFCGGNADWYVRSSEAMGLMMGENVKFNTICCDECLVSTPEYGTKEEAIKAWNTRAESKEVKFLKARLEEAQEEISRMSHMLASSLLF